MRPCPWCGAEASRGYCARCTAADPFASALLRLATEASVAHVSLTPGCGDHECLYFDAASRSCVIPRWGVVRWQLGACTLRTPRRPASGRAPVKGGMHR